MAAASSRFRSVGEEDLVKVLNDRQNYTKTTRLFALESRFKLKQVDYSLSIFLIAESRDGNH